MRIDIANGRFRLAALFVLVATPAWSACVTPPASPQAISLFRGNPGNFVSGPNVDTGSVELATRDLAGTDATLAADLVRVAETARPQFQGAIAAGLAQAALACSTIDQLAAQLIQQAVAGFPNGQFQASFAAVSGDLSTAAAEAAASSASSSIGSVTVNNPNPGGTTGNNVPQGKATKRAITGVFATVTPSLSTSGTTASDPVSPTQ
jgi:hypothetical protein